MYLVLFLQGYFVSNVVVIAVSELKQLSYDFQGEHNRGILGICPAKDFSMKNVYSLSKRVKYSPIK